MEYNICPVCKTENEPEYIYCKNCGAQLNQSHTDERRYKHTEHTKTDYSSQYQADRNYNNDSFSGGYSNTPPNAYKEPIATEYVDGIHYNEMTVFVGKKAYQIMPKFCKMEITGSKISWCWPTAVLSFLFGPLGASLWFFYRKMYKLAVLFAAIGIILNSATTILTSQLLSEINLPQAESYYSSEGVIDIYDMLEGLYENMDYRYYIVSLIGQLVNISSLIFSGLFGYYLYKKHAVKTIANYRAMGMDMRYYQFGLASIGGTSGGMLAVGIAIIVFSGNIVQAVANFL